MKLRILKAAYVAPSGACVPEHWIEFNTEQVEINVDNEEIKLHGVQGFPYNWQIPVKSKMEIKSINKNKLGL